MTIDIEHVLFFLSCVAMGTGSTELALWLLLLIIAFRLGDIKKRMK